MTPPSYADNYITPINRPSRPGDVQFSKDGQDEEMGPFVPKVLGTSHWEIN